MRPELSNEVFVTGKGLQYYYKQENGFANIDGLMMINWVFYWFGETIY